MDDLLKKLNDLKNKAQAVSDRLQLPEKKKRLDELTLQSQATTFWQDEAKAKATMQEMSQLEEMVGKVEGLLASIEDQEALAVMAQAEDDETIKQDLSDKIIQLGKEYDQLAIYLFLDGIHDKGNALLSVHAGQGGTEACDWAEMLKRMYVRLAERKGWQTQLIHESRGEEAGIKAVHILFKGHLAYGLLKHEAGTHRLVRQSPFNADALRQTSFALVEVLPEIPDSPDVEIRDEDLEWQFFRSGGKGGQNVNKVNTAVRLTHTPSKMVIESSGERYQEQNRKNALSILRAKLWQKQEEQRKAELASLKGQKMASWGTQIRNYILHPYHLVKDVRTNIETSDTEAVLDGDLDVFIEAEIKL